MMDFSNYKRISIPEGSVIKIESNCVTLWTKGYVNQVPISIDTDGSIYNGCGYKDGYRVRSGGAETKSTGGCITGYIPVNGLDVVTVGVEFTNSARSAINIFDSSFNNLGQVVGNHSGYGIVSDAGTYKEYCSTSIIKEDNRWKWTVPPEESGVAFFRVTADMDSASDLIVTVNEEITGV
jgi:hypothetical protein